MKNIKLFEKEIELIQSEDYRAFVRYVLEDCVPDYFWEIGASSTGKYHPKFSQGLGGLVRHTKAVVLFVEEQMRLNTYSFMLDEYKDYCYIAAILHDVAKYGKKEYDKTEYRNHARNAMELVAEAWGDWFKEDIPFLLANAIKSHMGQWSEKEDRPFTNVDRCVHMADYMASRNFIDIPEIVDEWNKIKLENMDLNLPIDE